MNWQRVSDLDWAVQWQQFYARLPVVLLNRIFAFVFLLLLAWLWRRMQRLAGRAAPVELMHRGAALFDAVAILASAESVADLTALHAARLFVSDAMAHGKMIALTGSAQVLFACCGIEGRDAGMFVLESAADVPGFLAACAEGRYWPRIA